MFESTQQNLQFFESTQQQKFHTLGHRTYTVNVKRAAISSKAKGYTYKSKCLLCVFNVPPTAKGIWRRGHGF